MYFQKSVIIYSEPDFAHADASTLAAHYKSQGCDQRDGYDRFIIDRQLKPELSAKEFHKLFQSVAAEEMKPREEHRELSAHLVDTLNNQLVSIRKENNIWRALWEDGTTGTFPACPDPERFVYVHELVFPDTDKS